VPFIDKDQIEEVWGELLVDVLLLLGAGHRLIEAEIYLTYFSFRFSNQ
jgi:hypothetical protein